MKPHLYYVARITPTPSGLSISSYYNITAYSIFPGLLSTLTSHPIIFQEHKNTTILLVDFVL